MDAPTYPPAVEYRQPNVIPRPMSSQTTSIADLMANPQALAVLTAEIPGFQQRVAAGPLRPHLGNFSLRSLVQFGMFQSAQLDRVDASFAELHLMEGSLR